MTTGQEQELLLQIVKTWNISEWPEYRGFRCANCQEYKNEAWYHWLNLGGYRLPIHLCADTCEIEFKAGNIKIGSSADKKFDLESFGNNYKFSQKAQETFTKIIQSWPDYKEPELKAFTCDACNKNLDVDTVDNKRKGYHVWWKMDDLKTLTEFHFHKECGNNLRLNC